MSTNYRWSDNVEAVFMDSEWVILHAEQHTITKLNEVGGEIWANMKEPTTAEAIVQAIMKEYDVNETQAQGDVQRFLKELQEKDLIVED